MPQGVDPADPGLSPLRAASLADLPPALVLTCGYDPLRDEGLDVCRRRADGGGRADDFALRRRRHPRVVGHGGRWPRWAAPSWATACEGLRTALGTAAGRFVTLRAIELACGWWLAVLLVWAAVAKARQPDFTRDSFARMGVRWPEAFASGVPVIEALVAVLVVVWPPVGGAAALRCCSWRSRSCWRA